MTEFPSLTVLINTYRRFERLQYAFSATLNHIEYSDDLQWCIADDCSGMDYADKYAKQLHIWRIVAGYKRCRSEVNVVTTSINSGWGASANNALRQITTEYVYHQDDDFMLTRALNLGIAVALMEANPRIGMVRYASLACSEQYVYRQHEIDLSAWFPSMRLSGEGANAGQLIYLTLEPSSPSLYLYSQTPLIYNRKRWFDYYGYFPEGVTLGEGEEKYCHHVKDMLIADENAPQIAVLPEWIPMHYRIEREHSWQFTEVDNARAAQS